MGYFSTIFILPTLVLHCSFLLVFKKWLGPQGSFYLTSGLFILSLFASFADLYQLLISGNYYYFDGGVFLNLTTSIDSTLLFCVDTLALVCTQLVLFLTVFALYFGVEYMNREAHINRLLYLLILFATSVISLFVSYDYFLILLSWECIGLFSLLLVNFYSTRVYTNKAALKTFVFSRLSDMFMFITFTLSLVVFNTTDLSVLFLKAPFMLFHLIYFGNLSCHFLTFFTICLVLTGGIKAAQFFFHVWLPDAMEAPTPASALIHSSTLVVAGVFLVIRFSFLFEFALYTNYLLILLGAMTLAFGSIAAVFQNDIKKLVAYSTISQIGYLVCGCGFCCYEEVLIYLIVHALNKAFLFVVVGYTVHYFNGNTDMRFMGTAYRHSFDLAVLLFGTSINLAGFPYSAGFLGKELLVFHTLRDDFVSYFVRGCWMASFFFTPIYMSMLVFFVYFGPKKSTAASYRTITSFQVFKTQTALIWSTPSTGTKVPLKRVVHYLITRFQHTLITARPTIYLLFTMWIFFYSFGNFFLSVMFNFNTLTDTIPSSAFTIIKTHTIFMTESTNLFLSETLFFFIVFLLASSFLFLINLRLNFNHSTFRTSFFYEAFFALLLLYLLSGC